MRTKQYWLLLPVMCVLFGCQKPPVSTQETADQAKAYIALFEQELQSMDSLNSKALSLLLADTLEAKTQQQPAAAVEAKIKQASRQISAAAAMLEKKKIPTNIPIAVRTELLAAQDDLLRAYRIKLKSLEQLMEHQKHQHPYLLERYQELVVESRKTQNIAIEALSRAKQTAAAN